MVKRVNYFDGQLLRPKDFIDEQAYHIGMRRQHNQFLHSWGIADGLVPSADKGATKITISPGFAIDIAGQEIKLDNADVSPALGSFVGKSPYLTIAFNQTPTDLVTEKGTSGDTRIDLKPTIGLSETPIPGQELILGKITLDAQGGFQSIDTSSAVRTTAGARGGDLSVVSLNLTGLHIDDPNQQPRLSVSIPGRVDLQGSLKISGDLTAAGKVGIGTTVPVTSLMITKDALAAVGSEPFGDWQNNGQLFVAGATSPLKRLALGVDTIASPMIGVIQAIESSISARNLALNPSGGSVGVGTTGPVTRLHVNRKILDDNSRSYDANALMVVHSIPTATTTLNDPKDVLYLGRQGTSSQAYGAMATYKLSRYENAGGSNVGSRTRLDLALTHDAFDDANVMTWLSSGNVGIGTANPNYKLEVNGNVQLGGFTADEKDEWPNVVWYRDESKGWDEGIIKGDANKSWFGRAGFGIHMHQKRHFGFYSTGWDRLVDIEGLSGKMYVKGGLHAGCDPTQRAPQPGGNPTQNSAAVYLGSSDVYFTDPNHFHTAHGNNLGYAAIENAKDYEALMILGREGSTFGGAEARRVVRVWDYMQVMGNLNVTGVIQGRFGDLAEIYFSDVALEPGELVCLDPAVDRIIRSREARDAAVIGIVSTNPGVLLNAPETDQPPPDGSKGYPVALCGRVPCKVTDENGPIRRGDVLTASSVPGYAMRAEPMMVDGKLLHRPGTLVGKALAAHDQGEGVIDVFVSLR